MNLAAISSVGAISSSGIGDTVPASAKGAATASVSSAASAASSLSASLDNTTTVVTMADGETVTTVRNKASEIVSISTTPATRPPELKDSNTASSITPGGVNLTA